MNTKKTVLKNFGTLFGAQILTGLLMPLLYIYIARTLGDETFGKYSFIFVLTTIFLIVSDFGIKGVAIRDVARDPSKIEYYWGNIIFLKLLFSILSVFLYVFFITILHVPRDTTLAAYVFAGGLFFQSMSYAFRWVFHAKQIMEYEAVVRTLERIFLVGISALVLWRGLGLIALSVTFLITQIIICALAFVLAKRVVPISVAMLSFDRLFCKYLIKTSVFFALCEVLWVLYFRIDIVMLAKLKGETAVGQYNAAYVIISFITLISALSSQALFPLMSHLYETAKNKLQETANDVFRYLIFMALPIVPIIFVSSHEIISFLYGKEFVHSITALQLLIFAVFFILPANFFGWLLVSSNRHRLLTVLNLAGVIINILLNFILIPLFGYRGAAIATVFTEAAICFLLYVPVTQIFLLHSYQIIKNALPPFAVMLLIIVVARKEFLIPVLFISFMAYLGLSYVTGSIKKEDFSFLLQVIKKRSLV